MTLDDVIESIKESHHLQRPDCHSQGDLLVVSGPFIEALQTAVPLIDQDILTSVETHNQVRELKQTQKLLRKSPEMRRALRERGYTSIPPQVGALPYMILKGIPLDPYYVGTVNGEDIAVGIARKTGLVRKSNGEDVAGIIALPSTRSPSRYGCTLLETGFIQFTSFFQVAQTTICCTGQIVPPGVPIDLGLSDGEVKAGEYQIVALAHSFTLKAHNSLTLTCNYEQTKKVGVKAFEPVFRETLQEARKLGADNQLRVKAYREMSRCAEYALMLTNAHRQFRI